MKNVVDSSGWLEYFAGGPNARFFAPPIQATDRLIVPVICVFEVFKRLLAQAGEEDALRFVGFMSLGTVVALDREIALDAARISLVRKLAMADCLILATAQLHKAVLWTQDEHFGAIDGVKYFTNRPELGRPPV